MAEVKPQTPRRGSSDRSILPGDALADPDQDRTERYQALEAMTSDLDDEEDIETVLASLREARRTVAERRRMR